MAPSNVVSVKRVGGAPDHASRAKVFGPDANIDTLVCSVCGYGEKEDWTPTMKKSQCPSCGNREGHEIRGGDNPITPCQFKSVVFKPGSPESHAALESLVNSGWEVVCLAPFRMGPDHHEHHHHGKGTTIVHEYYIMLRKYE